LISGTFYDDPDKVSRLLAVPDSAFHHLHTFLVSTVGPEKMIVSDINIVNHYFVLTSTNNKLLVTSCSSVCSCAGVFSVRCRGWGK